jgi:putative transposase
MPFIRIWIHAVWSTKNREPLLSTEIRKSVFDHILTNAKSKDIFITAINGYTDHVHCLISLGSEQTISKVIQLIKGESSFWINKTGLTPLKFEWQDEYFSVSVGESQVENVRDYIFRQEEHHKTVSFQQEYSEFISKYNFDLNKK